MYNPMINLPDRSMKIKRTRSQERILQLLHSIERSLSAQEIYLELRNRNQNTGLATVYRALEALKQEGCLQVRTLPKGESLYGSVHQDQHHLTCLRCGESIPLDSCPVHQIETELQASHNFKVYYHTLEFFGLCNQCQLAESH